MSCSPASGGTGVAVDGLRGSVEAGVVGDAGPTVFHHLDLNVLPDVPVVFRAANRNERGFGRTVTPDEIAYLCIAGRGDVNRLGVGGADGGLASIGQLRPARKGIKFREVDLRLVDLCAKRVQFLLRDADAGREEGSAYGSRVNDDRVTANACFAKDGIRQPDCGRREAPIVSQDVSS